MKILHLITRLILGGAQQYVVMAAAAQVRAGHQVWIAHGPIYGPEGSLHDEAVASGATVVELRSMHRAILPVHDLMCYRATRRLIRRIEPQVVQTHSSKAGIVGRTAAWAEGVPAVIHTVHGLPFHDRQPHLIHRLYVGLERWAARRCHHLIAISPAMIDAFVKERIATRERFSVVSNAIDFEAYHVPASQRDVTRRELGIDADAPVLAIVARLDPLKGHDDLLDILPDLLKRFATLRVLFIGDGWRRRTLEDRIRREGWDNVVTMTGLVPPARVPRLLAAVDVKVLPSHQEGQGRTLAEALLCGCGVVAYDVGGIGSIVLDGRTGRLAPVGDKAALGRAIAQMIEQPHERRRMVEAGRAHIRSLFDPTAMARAMQGVYEQVLTPRSDPHV